MLGVWGALVWLKVVGGLVCWGLAWSEVLEVALVYLEQAEKQKARISMTTALSASSYLLVVEI